MVFCTNAWRGVKCALFVQQPYGYKYGAIVRFSNCADSLTNMNRMLESISRLADPLTPDPRQTEALIARAYKLNDSKEILRAMRVVEFYNIYFDKGYIDVGDNLGSFYCNGLTPCFLRPLSR